MTWYRTSRQHRGYGAEWQKIRLIVLEEAQWLCQCPRCKGKGKLANEVDHIVPKAQGGTDALSNLRAVSTECHRWISAQRFPE